jgi:hypothetical protein
MSDPSEPPHRLATLTTELGKKPIELAALLLAAGTTGALAAMNLAISRYLAVFNQPGLIASAEGFSPALIRSLGALFVAILLLTTMIIAAPVFSRHLVRSADGHPLEPGFDWPNKVDKPRWRNLITYLVAHGPLVTLLIYYALASLFPKLFNHQAGITLAYFTGLIPSALFVLTGQAKDRKWSTFAVTTLTTAQLGLFALSWFVAVLILFGDPGASTSTPFSWGAAGQVAGLMLTILAAHWFLTVISTQAWASLTFGLAILVAVLVGAPGDLAITYNVLRLAGVGGGVPKIFRDPKAAPDDPPKTACMILSTGDLQVIKLAPNPADCDATAMRALFFKLRNEGAQARARDLALVRVVRREVFIAPLTPADIALEPASPAPAKPPPKTP